MSLINIHFENINPIAFNKDYLDDKIKYLISNELAQTGDINLIFCSDDYLLDMNKEYLNHNYFTDIITFDYREGELISGDLFISVDRVKENANTFNSVFLEELYRVIFHGLLHIIGYKDKSIDEKKQMRKKENYYLNRVDFSEVEE